MFLPDPLERRLEARMEPWPYARPPAQPAFLKPPGCDKHLVALDAQGRCPLCHDLGVRPPWW